MLVVHCQHTGVNASSEWHVNVIVDWLCAQAGESSFRRLALAISDLPLTRVDRSKMGSWIGKSTPAKTNARKMYLEPWISRHC